MIPGSFQTQIFFRAARIQFGEIRLAMREWEKTMEARPSDAHDIASVLGHQVIDGEWDVMKVRGTA